MTRLEALARSVGEPLLDPTSRTFLPSLLVAALVAAAFRLVRGPGPLAARLRSLPAYVLPWRLWTHRSSVLDLQILLLRQLLGLLVAVPTAALAVGIATGLVHLADGVLGRPSTPDVAPWIVAVAYTAVVFVAWDASRFLLHRAMHRVPALWALHQVHHSAEVLTPVTFHRLHPLESALYGLRGAVVGGVVAAAFFWVFRTDAVVVTVLGVHALGFLLDAAFGNLRHSHVWLRFGPAVERWLMSPAQHQLHHSADPADFDCNYGTWLAVFDRWGGSLRLAGERPPSAVGLAPGERNHAPDDLVSALVDPVVAALRALRPRGVAAAFGASAVSAVVGALAPHAARADEPVVPADAPPAVPVDGPPAIPAAPAPPVEDDEGMLVIVEGEPQAPGSAHVIGEQELERYEYNNVGDVVRAVPGVNVREEDGYGLRPNIGIRGANSDRSSKITLMEDGVLFAPAPYAAPAAYYFPMITRMVGLEVYKGPAAIAYGPNTVGGAINLLTRSTPPSGAVARLDAAGGLYTTFKLHGYAGYGTKRWGILGEAVHLSTNGFKKLDTGGPTGFDHQELMLKARVGSDPELRVRNALELKFGYTRERSNETYLGLSLDDFHATPYRRYAASDGNLMRFQRTTEELTWRLDVGRDADLKVTAYHHWLGRVWTKLNRFAGGPEIHDVLLNPNAGQAAVYADILRGQADTTNEDEVLLTGSNDRTFHAFGVQAVARYRARAGIVSSQLEIGARLHGDDVRKIHTEDPFAMTSGRMVPTGGATSTILDTHATALAFAGYVHEDLGVGPVRLVPGVRLEVIRSTFQDFLADPATPAPDPLLQIVALPGFGFLATATPWLDVLGGVHRGFSPAPPGSTAGTKAESSWNYEAGLRVSDRGTRLDVVGFFNDYQNLTGQCTLSSGCDEQQIDQSFNGGKVYVWGVEALASQHVTLPKGLGLDGRVSYTYTGSRFRSAFVSGFDQFGDVQVGDELPYVPTHQGVARLALTHPFGSLALSGTLRGAMRDVAGQGPIPVTELLPLAFTLDFAADVRVSKNVTAYTTITNMTNRVNLESFRPFGARPGAPIQAMIGLKVGTQ